MNVAWLSNPYLSLGTRLSYYVYATSAILRDRIAGTKVVRYLGRPFHYDSPITPLILLQYPQEIRTRIIDNTTKPIRSVLDIGGNIGQFSATFFALGQDVERIDIFEPNPDVFEYLQQNMQDACAVRCFNVGVGPDGSIPFHYTPGYSGLGSVIVENATYRATSELTSIDVELVSNIAAATGNDYYDLVKVDVEGFEYEVIEAIEGLKFQYLYIEITGPAKNKSRSTSALYALLREKFGDYEVRYQAEGNVASTVFELLLEFDRQS